MHHRFLPGPSTRTLLLLHGTGGDESDLIPLGRELDPNASLLSPRGSVLENGMPRFFRRLAEGVFDFDDVRTRAAELAAFIADSAQRYAFDPARLVAVGYSNGANIATALLHLHPASLPAAALWRAMIPLPESPPPASLAYQPILLLNGQHDPIVPAAHVAELIRRFIAADATVTDHLLPTAHSLTRDDLTHTRSWLDSFSD